MVIKAGPAAVILTTTALKSIELGGAAILSIHVCKDVLQPIEICDCFLIEYHVLQTSLNSLLVEWLIR